MNTSISDQLYISQAIQLASRGLYSTQPNPRVGCVIVANNEVVGEGYHQQAGGPHAEIYALHQAGKQAKGATAYVSLEPCSHQGKTPPCADALIDAGIARVVCAMLDPNPLVSGSGLEKLKQAGIETSSGVMQAEAEAINLGFIKRMKTGMPFVRVKLAMSLDGRTAMSSGESKWITGEHARNDVQRLRARSSVILTGSGTVVADDPSMNVRLSAKELNIEVEPHQPLRAVIDSQLKVSTSANIFKQDGETIVFSAQSTDQTVQIAERKGRIDLHATLKYLVDEYQANEVHVEAGSELAGALLEQKLIDELVIYIAPHIMGDSAKGLFHLPGLDQMAQRVELEIKQIRPIGKDWRVTATPIYKHGT